MAFTGKTGVITGGTGGIGFATAHHLLQEGISNIALLDIFDNKEKVEALKRDFRHANVILLVTDITKRDIVERTLKIIFERFKRIDIVVNSAGILKETEIDLVLNTNLLGLINTSLAAMKLMSKENGGNGGIIVNVASVLGFTVLPGTPIYNATKHGVIGFTRSLGHECYYKKHGVKFIAVCPGLTDTRLVLNFEDKVLFSDAAEATANLLSTVPVQSTDVCGKCISMVIATARNGSLWIIDDGKVEEFSIAKYWRL